MQQGATSDIELRPGVVQQSACRGAYIGASSHTFNMVWPQKCTCISLAYCSGVKLFLPAFASAARGRVRVSTLSEKRKKIRLIEGNAKCRHLNKFSCKGTFRQVFICLRPITRCDIMALGFFCSGIKRS